MLSPVRISKKTASNLALVSHFLGSRDESMGKNTKDIRSEEE